MTRLIIITYSAILRAISGAIIITALLILTAILFGLACGCSRPSQPVEIRTEHHTITTDSLSRLLALTIASRTSERDKETVYVFSDRVATVSPSGDTTRADNNTLILSSRDHGYDRSLYISSIDSLRQVIAAKDSLLAEKPVRIEVPKPAPLTAWQRIRIGSFWPLLAVLILTLAWHRWGHLFRRRKSF